VTPEVNAIATVFLALSVLLVTLFFLINRKKT
jgi:spermidine/putrescine transport system permease protein